MILLIGGEKGGTGKTTLAVNLASYRQSKGRDVLIIDTDTQGSASDWCYYRQQAGLPVIECIQLFGRNIISEIPNKAERYQDIVIDAGGRDSAELRASMVVSDRLLVPVRASQYDLASIETINNLLQQATLSNPDLKCMAVVNGLKNNPRIPEFTEALEALKEYPDIQALPHPLFDRMVYARSGAEGRGVHEMADPKASAEIETLYNYIYEQV